MKEQIAKTCHAAHNALCEEPIPWELKTSEHKATVYSSIDKILSGEILSAKQAHDNFVARKKADGWVYGEEYSTEDKINPRVTEFENLGLIDLAKEKIFFNIVESFK